MLRRICKAFALPLLLFLINAYFAKELFTLDYSLWMGSIEAAYVAISRHMIHNWRDLAWFPLWYCGIPFQNTYPPLLHALVAATSAALDTSPALAHHAVCAFFYCLGPVLLFALALRLTTSHWYSFSAALAYSLLSPSIFLIPAVRSDMPVLLSLRRFHVLIFYGEGPHITALAILPAALILTDVALTKCKPIWYLAAAAGMASVVLSNWLGALALALGVLAYLVARSKPDSLRHPIRLWLTGGGVGLLAYALACPWIPPSTISDIRYNAQFVGDFRGIYRTLPMFVAGGIATLAILKIVFHRIRFSQHLQFFLLFAFLTSAITLSAEWFNVLIVPQPHRYHLEMDMALCLMAPFFLKPWMDRLSQRHRCVIAVLLLALCVFAVRSDRRFARRWVHPIDATTTIEYRSAKWLDQHAAGERVFVPGTVSFWLNAFANTPQYGGGFDQGLVNRQIRAIQYQILSSEGAGDKAAEIATLWLKAYGVHLIEVGGSNSREVYKPFRWPNNFKSLQPVWSEGDDVIYRVAEPSFSLAHAVTRESLVRDAPINGLDIGQAQRYVHAITNPTVPLVRFVWTTWHSAAIDATLQSGQVLSIHETYHPGWRATANSFRCRITPDGLGQIVIDSGCQGSCRVELFYDGGFEMRLARILSWVCLTGSLLWSLLSRGQAQLS